VLETCFKDPKERLEKIQSILNPAAKYFREQWRELPTLFFEGANLFNPNKIGKSTTAALEDRVRSSIFGFVLCFVSFVTNKQVRAFQLKLYEFKNAYPRYRQMNLQSPPATPYPDLQNEQLFFTIPGRASDWPFETLIAEVPAWYNFQLVYKDAIPPTVCNLFCLELTGRISFPFGEENPMFQLTSSYQRHGSKLLSIL